MRSGAVAGATGVEVEMSARAGEEGEDPGNVAATDASKRLEWSRREALNRALAERRRNSVAQVALSLAEILSDDGRSARV